MFFVLQCWHRSCDHLTLKSSKAPCLSSELDDSFDSDFDAFFFLGIGKVLDRDDNLVHHSPSGGIDTLLGTAAGEGGKQGLLAPDRFFAGALVADMIAHRGEQRVGLVVAATEAKQEGPEDTIGDHLCYGMCNIRGSELPRNSNLVRGMSIKQNRE
jgi:hypothetical protein